MILGFMQFFDTNKKNNTYFRERILCGAGYASQQEVDNKIHVFKPAPHRLEYIKIIGGIQPKLHTMREDKHDRWKPGMSIQMVYRGPKYSIAHEFNKGIEELSKCVSTQRVRIEDWNDQVNTGWENTGFGYKDTITVRGVDFHNHWMIFVDDQPLTKKEIDTLAINDGFKDTHEFFKWFNKDWRGKIIHWTNLRY